MKKTQLEINSLRQKYPNVPEYALPVTRNKKSSPTAELTHQVITYVKSKGGIAFRLNSTGIYDPTKNKFRTSGQQKGLSDVIIIFAGHHVSAEIKASKTDKLSVHQLARKAEIEQAGGYYIEVRTFDQFCIEFDYITEKIKAK